MRSISVKESPLPGFGISLGVTLLYVGFLILLPLAALIWKGANAGISGFIESLLSPRVLSSLFLSFRAAFFSSVLSLIFGTLIAWVLVRYRFPGRRIIDALIDLPFALPTAIAGIALTSLYAPSGPFGAYLQPIQVAFTPLGIVIALTFVGFPFVVRSIQAVLEELPNEIEEASATIGAHRFRTFTMVIFPLLGPSMLSGFTLSFARGLGEYGSVVFISGNMPLKTEILPLLVMTKLEQFDYLGATVLAIVMLGCSLLLLVSLNLLEMVFKWRQ